MKEVDQPVEDVSTVRVFRLKFADAGEMADLLTSLYGDENKTDENNRLYRFFVLYSSTTKFIELDCQRKRRAAKKQGSLSAPVAEDRFAPAQ